MESLFRRFSRKALMESLMKSELEEVAIEVGLSLSEVISSLQSAVSGIPTVEIKYRETLDWKYLEIIEKLVPKHLSETIIESIALSTIIRPSTALSMMESDRNLGLQGALGAVRYCIDIEEATDSSTTLVFDESKLDHKPVFKKDNAPGLIALSAASNAALEYEFEEVVTARQLLCTLIHDAPYLKCGFCGKDLKSFRCENCEHEFPEKSSTMLKDANERILKGIEEGRITTCFDAVMRFYDLPRKIVQKAWKESEKERAAAYWRAHPDELTAIEADIATTKKMLERENLHESRLEQELSEIKGFFKGGRRREFMVQISESRRLQAELREKLNKFETKRLTYQPK